MTQPVGRKDGRSQIGWLIGEALGHHCRNRVAASAIPTARAPLAINNSIIDPGPKKDI
jgi:hypothetical protein